MKTILSYLAGPLIGAVIGYFTNYIAVKMLFYPRREVRIGGWKVPFTPGAIPKGKPRLAKAIGDIVGNTLLTKEDITKQLTSGAAQETMINQTVTALRANLKQSVCDMMGSEGDYDSTKENVITVLGDAMLDAVSKFDIRTVVVSEGGRIIKEKTAGTMLAMFVSDELIQSFTEPAGEEIEAYIRENGREKINQELREKIGAMEEQSFADLLQAISISEDKLKGYIANVYQNLIGANVEGILPQLHVARLVEDKVNGMSVIELEQLVMTVMKKELNMIVNLGALIGFMLGLLNILI